MALYVDANYTVDDADYFTDNPAGTYVFCDYWLTFPDAFAEGDELCPIATETDTGPYMGRKKKRKGLASPPPLLVPAVPNDDDEVMVRVLELFMGGHNVH